MEPQNSHRISLCDGTSIPLVTTNEGKIYQDLGLEGLYLCGQARLRVVDTAGRRCGPTVVYKMHGENIEVVVERGRA